jgi:hypothetical protein
VELSSDTCARSVPTWVRRASICSICAAISSSVSPPDCSAPSVADPPDVDWDVDWEVDAEVEATRAECPAVQLVTPANAAADTGATSAATDHRA